MVKNGLLYSDAFPGTSLVGLFGRYGNLDGAMKHFKEMPYRNLVTWNSRDFFLWASWVNKFRGWCLKLAQSFTPQLQFSCKYVQCADVFLGENVFEQIHVKDMVSWSIIIRAFAKSIYPGKTLDLFLTMPLLCDWLLGGAIHGHMIKMDFSRCDLFVCNILVDIPWAPCLHGFPCVALERFREMESVGIKLDRVAFIAVLSACRHGGLVEEGLELFGSWGHWFGYT
ncbi:hypothetical protein IFM89_000355 [Coptis chinensis]|uniref:Pentatricopeptide repeat-containing protein n=1 Tax=Coptis chinensis TaxID=261450 RepID=A0A835HBU8_9MAGN|nr:hypothetical protein IFM89_000355 [Coptis chinensis]